MIGRCLEWMDDLLDSSSLALVALACILSVCAVMLGLGVALLFGLRL